MAGLRIALTSVHAWPGVRRGAERYLHELAAALQDAGHGVQVLSTGEPARDEVLGVPVRRVPLDHWGTRSFVALATRRLDVWHATSAADGAAAATTGRIRPRVRTVFTDHGFPVRRSHERSGHGREYRTVVRHVDHYVNVSETAAAHLPREYGRTADVVPPGVDTDRLRPGPGRSPTPVVLYSGALDEPRKNVRTLVDAVGRLPGVALWLVGQGTPDLSGLATDHVELQRLARPDELPQLYRAAWVTALPSTAECFGMALTESLACGTPGVGRLDGGGPAEILVPGTGVLCGEGPEALAGALAQAMELTPTAVDACRARAEDFDWRKAVVPALERLYTS